jgi:hypothetical protein
VLGNIAYKYGKDVKIKDEKEWKLSELNILYNTLNTILAKFNNSTKAFHNAFGQLTFEMLPDWKANLMFNKDQMGKSDYAAGVIEFRHGAFTWSEGYYGAAGWAIAHEMGHVFDMKGANGNPKLYFSNVFVEGFDNGGCYLGPNGCLGDQPWTSYKWLNLGLGIGDYQPSGSSTPYGLHVSSTEDFAESFAAYMFNGTGNAWVVDDDRKNIIQIDVAVMVSYSQ